MPKYITLPIETNPEDLAQQSYEFLQAKIPNWRPANGNLETWMLQATASEAADLMRLVSQVPAAIFRWFGTSMINIQPVDATFARVDTTWTMIDNAGYTIPSGTEVGIRSAGDELIPFIVVADVVVPAGSTVTGAGAVPIEALIEGEVGSGLGSVDGPVELITPLIFVSTITQEDITTGGVDAETDDDYLDRLRAELQLMSPRPILPGDFSVLAREHPSVYRATTIDGYNPADSTFGNERMVAVATQDVTGAASSSQVKTEVDAMLEALREVNFIVNVIDPVFKQIAVTFTIQVLPGRNSVEVIDNVKAALGTYLDPKLWGIPEDGDTRVWENHNVVRYLEIASVINSVPGVDYIGTLFIGLQGGSLTATDYTMTGGPAMLPTPGTFTGAII